jgi:hypothetical protein
LPEGGLSATEVGKELQEHAKHASENHHEGDGAARDRIVTIIEATLLAVVAVLAAWSGYSSAKWATQSRLDLAKASTARTQANEASLTSVANRTFDSSTFNAWFSAYVTGNAPGEAIAVRRFRPEFRVAFDAWMSTDPFNNPNSPPGPLFMPQYAQPDLDRSTLLNAQADQLYSTGSKDGSTADDYVRATVYLATVLFLVGISGHFSLRSARIGLVVVGSAILLFTVIDLVGLPRPPA